MPRATLRSLPERVGRIPLGGLPPVVPAEGDGGDRGPGERGVLLPLVESLRGALRQDSRRHDQPRLLGKNGGSHF